MDELDELKKKLALDVDARYGMASTEHLMTEKEHFEIWDKMFELKKKRLVLD